MLLEAINVSKVYSRAGRTVHALDDVSLQVREGRTLGIVGESGSGKTTLMKLLLGLEAPTSGSVLVNGVDLKDLGRDGRREFSLRCSAVFQNPFSSLSPRMRIWKIITEQSAVIGDEGSDARRRRATEFMSLVGLHETVLNRFPHQLSGGQRQRVAIARAMAESPSIIVLDEPMSALDVSVSAQIVNLLLELQERSGVGYLMVGHDMHIMRHLCHDVIVLREGVAVEAGESDQIFKSPQHWYTKELLAAAALEDLDIA